MTVLPGPVAGIARFERSFEERCMRGVLFPGDRTVRIAELPDPEPGPGEVVVAMRAAAICGSDLHGYRATRAAREASGAAGIVPGHEPAGVVHALGEGVTSVKVGDRVAVYHYRGCGHCGDCRGGRLMWCADRKGYGGPIHGSDADLLLTDARNCLPLPADVSYTAGALLMCVGGTAYEVMRKLDASGRATVAIFGLGPVGLTGMLMARAMGARVIGVDLSRDRLELAERLGIDAVADAANEDVAAAIRRWAGPEGVQAAFETSGSVAGQAGAVEAAGRNGRVCFVGFGAQQPALSPAQFIEKQLTLFGSFVFPIDRYEEMLGFVRTHEVPLEATVTHTVPLDDAEAMFAAFDRGETGKVAFAWAD
jgi:propanol-preferring alcohol dehydrogenase